MPVPGLFDTVSLGPLTLRNRIVKAATFEGRTPGALVSDDLVAFHRAVGAGGTGMTTVAYVAVAPEGRTHADQIYLREEALPGLVRLTDAVHETGAKVAAQIGHAGPVANGRSNGVHAVAPSRMPSPLSMQMVRAATEADLDRILRQYVAGARLAVRAGFDSLEMHLGHSYLLSAFLAPALNRRNDRYGGSLANRATYPRRVLRAVKEEVGDEVAVTAKLGMVDGFKGGVRIEESLELATWLEQDGCLDALELSAGSSLMNPMYLFRGDVPAEEFAAQMPLPVRLGMRTPVGRRFLKRYPYEEAFLLPHARRFRESLSLPLMLLGGLTRRETMDAAVAEGFEFVVLGRALLREPDLPNRLQTGEADRASCIHCNRCMPSIYTGTRCVLDHPLPLELTERPGLPIVGGAA